MIIIWGGGVNKPSDPRKVFAHFWVQINAQSKVAALSAVIFGIINYSYLIMNHVKSPDAVAVGSQHISGNWELSLGRFGIQFIDKIRGGVVNETLIYIFSIFIIAITCGIIISIFDVRDNLVAFLMSAVLITSPQLADTFMFTYCADAYCVSVLFSAISVWFLKQWSSSEARRKRYILFSATSIMIAASLYQAYIGLAAALCIILLIKELVLTDDLRKVLFECTVYALSLLGGLLLYYGVNKAVLAANHLNQASYKGASNFGITYIIRHLSYSLLNVYKDFFGFLFREEILYNDFWKRNLINAFLMIVLICMLFSFLKRVTDYKAKVFLLFLLLAFPAAVCIMDIIVPDTKINLVTGLPLVSIYFLILVLYDSLSINLMTVILKYTVVILNVSLIFGYINSDNVSFMCREDVFNHFYATHAEIIIRAESLSGYNSDMKWCFNDIVRYRSTLTDKSNGFIANDNEVWNNYDGIGRTAVFYKQYFGKDINICSRAEYDAIVNTREFESMSTFPDDSSIKIINDVVVVKINNFVHE